MIQYQYFHTAKGYIFKLSLKKDEENYGFYKDIFEGIRVKAGVNAFLYAPLEQNRFVFLQSSNSSTGFYAKGLSGAYESADMQAPARYIDKLEKEASNDALSAESTLISGAFPPLGRMQDDFSLAQILKPVFHKLFDIIIRGDKSKPVIIIAGSHEEAVNYIKVLSLLLPPQFMKKTGFCIGTSNIFESFLPFINDAGKTETASVRIWLPEIKNFDFNAYAAQYYVFDTKTDRDNYTQELSVAAKTVHELDISHQTRASGFARAIAPAFNAFGQVDCSMLDKLCALYSFEMKRDVPSAKEILKMGSSGSEQQKHAVLSAVEILLAPDNRSLITAAERKMIADECQKHPDIAQLCEEPLLDCFALSFNSLSETERRLLINMTAKDKTGDRLEKVCGFITDDFQSRSRAFGFVCEVLAAACKNSRFAVQENAGIIAKAANIFGIENCYRIIPREQISGGEAVFDEILKISGAETKSLSAAILMMSAYADGAAQECCKIRINGLKRFFEKSGLKKADQFDFLLGLRNKMLEISDEIPLLSLDTQFDFLFNNKSGELWINSLIDGLSMEEILEVDDLVKSRRMNRSPYESMTDALTSKLLKLEFVKENVKNDNPVNKKYIDFFRLLPQETINAHADIKDYLDNLGFQAQISERFSAFRYNFAYGCFKTLSETDKMHVLKNSSSDSFMSVSDPDEKTRIVEGTIQVFGTVKRGRMKRRRSIKPFAIWAFVFSIIAALLLALPPVVESIAVSGYDVSLISSRVAGFVKPAFFAVVAYVYLLNTVSYFLLKTGNKLFRANMITLLCGLLPIAAFAAVNLLLYFTGFNINLPFLQ